MTLSLFDLDHTLIMGDSDRLWGEFLLEENIVDDKYQKINEQFYIDYSNGEINITNFLKFSLVPLKNNTMETLIKLRKKFFIKKIKPLIPNYAFNIIKKHNSRNDKLIIITSSNQFYTQLTAQYFGIDTLLATIPEIINNKFTGNVSGTPCFQNEKINKLHEWLEFNQEFNLTNSYFYSDSHNDLPLLKHVDNPIAVNPDPILSTYAKQHNWPIIGKNNYNYESANN